MGDTTRFLLFLALLTVVSVEGSTEKQGSTVVEAVVSRITAACIFPDDKLFTRRLAYVESRDGEDPKTYRDGYHGGIWQVDEAVFQSTQNQNFIFVMLDYLFDIHTAFGIDWSRVQWSDLRDPLHSALAARLYLQFESRNGQGVSRDIPGQAAFWVQHYRSSENPQTFIDAAENLEQGCKTTNHPDLVFVLDGSGSVGDANFQLIRDFVKEIVRGFKIGPDATRVGLIRYSTAVSREFDLKDYTTEEELLAAIDAVAYTGGGTMTHMALDEMRIESFSESNGARPRSEGRPRVGIVLTDGLSNHPSLTVESAMKAHDADITMIAIGVTDEIDERELDVIASEPKCMHKFILKYFDEMEALTSAIEQRSCEAPIIISPGEECLDYKITANANHNCRIRVPSEGATVRVLSSGGEATMFLARDTFPSYAYFEAKARAVPGVPAAIFVPKPPTEDEEGVVFCNFAGDQQNQIESELCIEPGDRDWCRNSPCMNGGTCINNGDDFSCRCPPGFGGQFCQTKEEDGCSSAPCQNGGTCVSNGGGDFSCTCPPGFKGTLCEERDWCFSSPCLNGGTCQNEEGGYSCRCPSGFKGTNCEERDWCSSSPCVNGGTCQNEEGGYSCTCPPGFEGTNCEERDWCSSSPCLNGGTCDNDGGDYSCRCPSGFKGRNCEERDWCSSAPCQNGGTCENQGGDYSCTCPDGFRGRNCEERDWCSSNPCRNGGTCENRGDDFLCVCPEGFRGRYCRRRIPDRDWCRSNPCQNGGTCVVNGPRRRDGFSCKCEDGWTGDRCDTKITTTTTTTTTPAPSGGYDCGDNNPCTPENASKGKFYFEHTSETMFVQCSEWGQCFEMPCPGGLVWSQSKLTCTWP